MIALHCDRDGCDTWQRQDSGMGCFITLTFAPWLDEDANHFCTLDCVMQWSAAHSEPTENLVEL